MIKPKQLGLTLGIFFAVIHAIWALIVGLGYGQKFLSWIMSMHFMGAPMMIGGFTFGKAFVLIAVTFIAGYIFGWLFAVIWNWVSKKIK